MSEATVTALAGESVMLADVERALVQCAKALQKPGEGPVMHARMSNLVVYCDRPETADAVAAAVPEIVAAHPARVLLLLGEPDAPNGELATRVCVRDHCVGRRRVFSEQVTLHAAGASVQRLPFAVRGLVIGDLPVNLWWASTQPPPLGGVLFHELAERAEQVVYDSIGWPEPARGVVAVANWLAQLERSSRAVAWRVASDLNWRRLKVWRRMLTQATAPDVAPGLLETVTELTLEHGPHAVVQAWELVSWMGFRLGFTVKASRIQPGVEISWQFERPNGQVRVRLRRLEQGPPRIHRLRIESAPGGKQAILNLTAEDDCRLTAMPEGTGAAPRTVSVPPQTLAGLVGRQLSDRERDPVFRESMSLARVLAESVLDHS